MTTPFDKELLLIFFETSDYLNASKEQSIYKYWSINGSDSLRFSLWFPIEGDRTVFFYWFARENKSLLLKVRDDRFWIFLYYF